VKNIKLYTIFIFTVLLEVGFSMAVFSCYNKKVITKSEGYKQISYTDYCIMN